MINYKLNTYDMHVSLQASSNMEYDVQSTLNLLNSLVDALTRYDTVQLEITKNVGTQLPDPPQEIYINLEEHDHDGLVPGDQLELNFNDINMGTHGVSPAQTAHFTNTFNVGEVNTIPVDSANWPFPKT